MKKLMLMAALAFAAFTTASAQQQEPEVITEFKPHLFLQLQNIFRRQDLLHGNILIPFQMRFRHADINTL